MIDRGAFDALIRDVSSSRVLASEARSVAVATRLEAEELVQESRSIRTQLRQAVLGAVSTRTGGLLDGWLAVRCREAVPPGMWRRL